jgi:hypothetical protein
MKYDDIIKNKYVYDTLLTNKKDAEAKPINYMPELLPRRKTLNYIADIPDSDKNNINMKEMPSYKGYYDTKVDALYGMKPIGHDVYNTDIMKQKKELGVLDS